MKRVYSGIRATGRLHLGNYFGAVKGMLALQDSHDCVFSVVDLHTITVPYDPKTLQSDVRNIILDYLAAGLDPKKCKLEIQSKVPQHTELAYLLSTIYPVSRLEDLPTYKDKKAQYPKYVNMGLLYYPILMAADILLYKAELVPVGIDQEPHLEVAREMARKFNSMFGHTFPEPQRFTSTGSVQVKLGEYIPSLLGEGKMSKSVEGSYINLVDDLETIKEKLAKVPTDSGVGEIKNRIYISVQSASTEVGFTSPSRGLNVLMTLVELFQGKDKRVGYEEQYQSKGIRYQSLKDELAGAIHNYLKPIQEKRKEFEASPTLVDSILEESLNKCRKEAEKTILEVRQKMGLDV